MGCSYMCVFVCGRAPLDFDSSFTLHYSTTVCCCYSCCSCYFFVMYLTCLLCGFLFLPLMLPFTVCLLGLLLFLYLLLILLNILLMHFGLVLFLFVCTFLLLLILISASCKVFINQLISLLFVNFYLGFFSFCICIL